MTHVLVVGRTESGKTLLAKQLVQSFAANGTASIVLDPLRDPQWKAHTTCSDPHEFLELVKRSRECAVFLDESGETVGRYNDEMFWLATRARHYGHKTIFITQRPSQLSPTVRAQCSHLFCFAVTRNDAKLLAEEFGHADLERANTLPQFEYYYCGHFGAIEKRRVATPWAKPGPAPQPLDEPE